MNAEEFLRAHADNATSGKIAEVMKDLTPESLAQVGSLMAAGPNPIESSKVEPRGQEGDDFIFDVTYSGQGKSTTMREWIRQIDGTWKIARLEKPA
jgi:hypothetical protein